MGIGPPSFMLEALVQLNGWNQIPVSFVSPAPVPGLVSRHPVSPLPCWFSLEQEIKIKREGIFEKALTFYC